MTDSKKMPLPTDPNTETVNLDSPIIRGEQSINELTIRKPKTGALRGLALADLMKLEVNTLIKVIPRVSVPAVTEQEIAELDPSDFINVSTAVVGFFTNDKARKEAREKAQNHLNSLTA